MKFLPHEQAEALKSEIMDIIKGRRMALAEIWQNIRLHGNEIRYGHMTRALEELEEVQKISVSTWQGKFGPYRMFEPRPIYEDGATFRA